MNRSHATRRTIRYGPTDDQEGDLYLPAAPRPPVVCLLHGGFWRMPYGRDQLGAIAEDLVSGGLAIWNLEYRRLGTPGAGWPATLDDVARGIDHLARLADEAARLDLDRVTVVGHSAGGHPALWIAGRNRAAAGRAPRVRVHAAAGLAPIADLVRAHELRLGGGAVTELLGGTPFEHPERYRCTSPMAMLPLGARQLILHGTADRAFPLELSRRYVRAAAAAGDDVELVELPGTGHMEYLDPRSEAHAVLRRWLLGSGETR